MYFFQSILLILLIIASSFLFYQFIMTKKELSKKIAIFWYLAFIQILFIIYGRGILFYLFLDFAPFLGYLLKRRREALVLSFINILYFSMILDIAWYFYLIYLVYFLIDMVISRYRRNSFRVLLCCKAFISSFVYFLCFEHSALGMGYMVFIFLYFYVLLVMVSSYLRNYEENLNQDNLLFKIAHEVKNPIAVCKGYLDMLDTSNLEKVNKYVPIVRSEMKRALTIMDDFLNLKRLTVNKEVMDLMLLLEDVDATMDSVLSNKKVSLKLNVVDDEVFIDGDYERLKQVFMNLIKNSYEAESKNIEIELKLNHESVDIFIKDDGVGIPSKDLKKVGQLFYTTKVKGTGIGVSMSLEIIRLHQGSIKYDSSMEKGTTVKIHLPSYPNF